MDTAEKATHGHPLITLFAALTIVYLVSGSGRFHIIDEVSLFAVTESLVKRGAFDTNAIAWTQWVNSPGEVLGAFGPEGDVFSKKGPAPSFLAASFYLIGWLLPPLSMLQTAFWLNPMVTALTAVLLARCALTLGYQLRTALAIGLLYGLGTIAWPYATHFFGESVSALAILGIFYTLLRLRQGGGARYGVLAGLAAGVMVATSAAHTLLLVPYGVYLVITVLGRSATRSTDRPVIGLMAFVVPLATIVGLLIWYNYARFGAPFSTGYHFEAGEGFTANWVLGLWGLLFSPYRGFFWYTPLALVSVVAWPGFVRRHWAEGWLLAAIALTLVGLFGKWWMWWGGFAWGPRFLVPLSPLVVLVLAPMLGSISSRPSIGIALLATLSFGVQLLAVSANYVNYEIVLRQIYPTDWADPLKYGPPALFNPLHSPIWGQLKLLIADPKANLDLGWISGGQVAWPVPLVAGTAILAVLLAGRALGQQVAVWLALAGVALTALVTARVYGAQPLYGVAGQGYGAALEEIARRAGRADGIVTVAPYHYQVPMARYRDRLPIYGYAIEPTPLHPETEAVLQRSLSRHLRLWLVTVGLPAADPANGVEVWLAQHAFKAEDRWFDDARLVTFVSAERLQPLSVAARLGDKIQLLAAQVNSQIVHPGGTLAVELTWTADIPPGDIAGFVQLLTPDGRLAVGQDGVPGGGYAPGPTWQPGHLIIDRRGLFLPPDLPAGEYLLIAGLYDLATGQRLSVADSSGVPQGDFVRLGVVVVHSIQGKGGGP